MLEETFVQVQALQQRAPAPSLSYQHHLKCLMQNPGFLTVEGTLVGWSDRCLVGYLDALPTNSVSVSQQSYQLFLCTTCFKLPCERGPV